MTILFFQALRPRTAVLFSVIGGFLFLPMASYNLPGIPNYTKITAIALGLIIGGILSGARWNTSFRWQVYDLPMAVFCFISPIATSLINSLGLYDGLSEAFRTYISWGVYYWAGRIYLNDRWAMRDLSMGIVIGGLIYMPLCLFEVRMSPQLSNMIYGFFPHSFAQHVRYGGYRPIVFMQHGLMVAMWMAQASFVIYWLWKNGGITRIERISIAPLTFILFVTTILCKSINGWFFLLVGIVCCYYFKIYQSIRLFNWVLFLIPVYIIIRSTGFLPAATIQETAALLVDPQRVESLSQRLEQENAFSEKAFRQPFFGWGGWDRGWPIDPETGRKTVRAVDALWTIILSTRGLVGLCGLYISMLLGPWLFYRNYNEIKRVVTIEKDAFLVDAIVLSLVVVFFMIDTLMNGMINPIYIICSGALVSNCTALIKEIRDNRRDMKPVEKK